MGKSRLVHEFTRHQLPPGWLVLAGASVSYGKATPYFPLIEMLHRYFQIADGESNEQICDKVVTHLLELDKKLKDTIPPILSLLGALPDENNAAAERAHDALAQVQDIGEMISRFNSMDPQQRRRLTLEAVKRLLVRESQRQPLLLVFEDLHWVDHETQAFLDGLVDSLPTARLMLLVNYRPEYNHEWSEKNHYTQVRVDPLETSSAEQLLLKLLGNNPDLSPLKELLIKRTEGNPFFAEESIRSLVETGFLIGEQGAYRPGLRMDGLVIPSTVQNLLADRIDRLPTEEKRLLQTAAVIGVTVPLDLLQAVSELADEQLFQYLAHLKSAEFIYETNLFPKLEYTFKHALTNEVAYGALLHDRRIALHARVVKALEAMPQTSTHDHIEELAHHAFSGELWNKSVEYLKGAGSAAVLRSSFRNAVVHFKRALEALRHLPETSDTLRVSVDLRFELRNCFFVLDNFQQGFRYLEEARTFALKLNDRRRLGMLFNFMTAFSNLEGNSEQAVTTGKQALEYTEGPEHVDIKIVAHYFLGVAYHNLGSYTQAISELKTALSLIGDKIYDRFGTTGIVSVISKSWLVRALAQLGQFADAMPYAEEAIKTARSREHPYSLVYAYYSAGVLFLIKGDIDDAIAALERGLKVCEALDIAVQRPLVMSCLSTAYAYAGRFDQALQLLESETDHVRWITGAGGQQLPFGKAMRMVWSSETYLSTGRLNEAEALAARVLEVSSDSKDKGSEAWLLRILGDVSIRKNPSNATQAEANYSAALELASESGMRPLQAHCLLGLAQLHAQAPNFTLAHSELLKAMELYQGMLMPFWLAKATTELRSLDNMRA
jgi:tetratricopeptide (TPR) repeat protein